MTKVTLDLPEIKGYEYTGEYRAPLCGEYWAESRTVFCMPVEEHHFIIRKIRPRAKFGEAYHYIVVNGQGVSVSTTTDCLDLVDRARHESGSYFMTHDAACVAATAIRKLLKESSPC